ncbi:HAD family hydrolase [Paenibacillus sp. UNC451MF]|uniref:HAD family hydrolase n=1 Tax=Paenibacillus sp. UNC451MF TaxID=1449063 RepID=UPI00049212AE|nr:HAD family hydrolase [Paenibacillus sp. UNC451MF]
MIKAIVFDFDGLIIDTETPEFESFQKMFEEHGAELSLDIWGRCIGTDGSSFEPYSYLEQCIGKPFDVDSARLRRREHFSERMHQELPRPGVLNYLERGKEMGLPIGLASSSTRQWVTGYLKKHELLNAFHCIRTRDDVVKAKPDPALYLLALEDLGVQPHEAVAFEDSPNGALAAKRAGMHCVIVPNLITKTLSFGEHDLRLNSMAEMPLEEVISTILSRSSNDR